MMDNLEKVLPALFRHIMVRDIIDGRINPSNIESKEFVRLMDFHSERYSETELKNLYQYFTDNFWNNFSIESFGPCSREGLNVFLLLQCYSNWILTEQNNEIVCKYGKFLHWRMITRELSEDLIVAAYLTYKKQRNNAYKIRFDWRPIITHNNDELHRLLENGMAENHSHLKGAFPVFQLTWVSIMNNLYLITNYKEMYNIEQNRRNASIMYKHSYQEEPFTTQILQAAFIRFLLFENIINKKCRNSVTNNRDIYMRLIHCPDKLFLKRQDLSNDINAVRNIMSKTTIQDYALAGMDLDNSCGSDRNRIFQGERWLIFYYLFEIISGKEIGIYKVLFYAYLVIKENFRTELVQTNDIVGFENFRIYEHRKDIFLELPFYKKELIRKAIEASLLDDHVLVAEERIAPKASANEICKYIMNLDQQIAQEKDYKIRMFYTMHFIKGNGKNEKQYFMRCRHYSMRLKYKKEAIAIAGFRKKYPHCANRIRGIDAANMEIGCGPEVFGQVFRFLSDHSIDIDVEPELKIPQLRVTYHVGEDFLDLVSGLRNIDEALCYLNMRCGDRLGHALALGVDIKEWYDYKGYRIILSQQEYLDNIAWMYNNIIPLDIDNKSNILDGLKKEFQYYFRIIYQNAIHQPFLEFVQLIAKNKYKGTDKEKYYRDRVCDFTIEDYYTAWELRGDNPELYKMGFYAEDEIEEYRSNAFSYYAINRNFPRMQNKRYIQEVSLLYYYYHYNEHVRIEGDKIIEKRIGETYILCTKILQKELQKKVAKKGISIETNPSSNFLIGTFRRYDKHPIINFYNKHLIEDGNILKECAQLNVSINTDDAGIFNTSLQNEYAYMAIALEKAKDENGNFIFKRRNIYEWLDSIRIMGLRQTFMQTEDMKKAIEGLKKDWEKT